MCEIPTILSPAPSLVTPRMPHSLPHPLSPPPKLPLAVFLLKQLCGGSYMERDLRLEEESASRLEEEEVVAKLDLLAPPPLRSSGIGDGVRCVGPAPSLEEGKAPLWLKVLLRWSDTSSFWQERREGGRREMRRKVRVNEQKSAR